MLTRSRASNQGVTVEQAMSAYIDAHRRPRHGQGDQQPPNGGNVAPLPVPDGAADTRSADHDTPKPPSQLRLTEKPEEYTNC